MPALKKFIALFAVVYVMAVIQFFARKQMSGLHNAPSVSNNMNILSREMLAGSLPGGYAASAITAMLK
ncbi:MAG: hypothetical protein DI535_08900 [Citrobacter freundii]|nr:MAG: hypothetical protein DI535_08900 [Citrobacter freundii]